MTLAALTAWAQSPASTPCPIGAESILPEQDCPGARWIIQTSTRVDVSRVTGPGCLTDELPTANQTCLTTGERRTVWYLLTIHGAPGGDPTPGAPAGLLRFVITPADVTAGVHPLSADSGGSMAGWTDYDFALFRVETQGTRPEACQVVRHALATGTAGSRQVACNYSGLPGRTGLWDAGTAYAVDDNRFCRPVPVRVGETYVLAIDNYSLDASWFTLDFDPQVPAGAVSGMSARVVPGSPLTVGPAQAQLERSPCGLEAIVTLPAGVSIAPTAGWLPGIAFDTGDTIWAMTWQPAGQADLTGETHRWRALFPGPLPSSGVAKLVWKGTPPTDRYGRSLTLTGPPIPVDLSTLGGLSAPMQACAGQSIAIEVLGMTGTPSGWAWGATSSGLIEKPSANRATVTLPHQPVGGDLVRVFLAQQQGGCQDTLWATIRVLPRPEVPTLMQSGGDTLEARATGAGLSFLWQAGLEPVPTAGPARRGGLRPVEYRVWAVAPNGCTSPEPARITPTLTQVRRLGQTQVTIWPQPTAGEVHVRLSGHTGPVQLTVLTSEGRILTRRASHPGMEAGQAATIDLTDRPPGAYLILIEGEGLRWLHRVIRR